MTPAKDGDMKQNVPELPDFDISFDEDDMNNWNPDDFAADTLDADPRADQDIIREDCDCFYCVTSRESTIVADIAEDWAV